MNKDNELVDIGNRRRRESNRQAIKSGHDHYKGKAGWSISHKTRRQSLPIMPPHWAGKSIRPRFASPQSSKRARAPNNFSLPVRRNWSSLRIGRVLDGRPLIHAPLPRPPPTSRNHDPGEGRPSLPTPYGTGRIVVRLRIGASDRPDARGKSTAGEKGLTFRAERTVLVDVCRASAPRIVEVAARLA
jgi:hypothetical protein